MRKSTKHLVYAFLLALFSSGTAQAQYQLSNSGFEGVWTDNVRKKYSENTPAGWNSFYTANTNFLTNLAFSVANQVGPLTKETDAHSGVYSAKIVSRLNTIGSVSNGNLTTGRINMGSTDATDETNYNYSDVTNQAYSYAFVGIPDSVTVWVKFIPKTVTDNASLHFIIHKEFNYKDPHETPENVAAYRIAYAKNAEIAKTSDGVDVVWKRMSVPFNYDTENLGSVQRYLLASFSTNANPGEGSADDALYVDDIAMIYNSRLDSIKYNGVKIAGFDKNKAAYEVTGSYTPGCLVAFADGKGSKVTVSYDEKIQTATIRVEGNDIQENADNYHEYTVKFYPSQLTDLYFNGRPVADFSKDKYEYEVSGVYTPYSICSFTKGVTIHVPGDYDAATSTLTLLVEDDNIDDDASNYHEYKVKFTPAVVSTEERTQLLNSDFEAWEDVSGFGVDMLTSSTAQISGKEPISWSSFLTAGGALAPFSAADKLVVSSDVRPNSEGTKSAKIFSNLALGTIVANGNLTTGRINAGGFSPTDAAGNYNVTSIYDPDFSSRFTGTPDSLTVWVKYIPNDEDEGKGPYMARVNAILHDSYGYQDPIPDALSEEMASHKVASAAMNYPSTEGVWKKLSIPFEYTGNDAKPAYALVSFTTNMTPGNGTAMDTVYVDDIEMIYNSQLDSIKYNDVKIAGFSKDKLTYSVTGSYVEDCLTVYADGKGAKTTVTYDEPTKTATIRVEGNDIQDNAANYHEYTVLFLNPDGINELSANGAIKLYRVDDVTIGLTGVEAGEDFCIYSQGGVPVMEGKLERNIINVKDLTNGVYILKVAGKNISFIR